MKNMVSEIMARLAGFSLGAGSAIKMARADKKNEPLQGQEQVKWEDRWYALDDGLQSKLKVRRGHGTGGQWTQFRNDYPQKVHCQAIITSITENGEKHRAMCFPHCEAAETKTFAPQPGQEISKVEISGLGFGDGEAAL